MFWFCFLFFWPIRIYKIWLQYYRIWSREYSLCGGNDTALLPRREFVVFIFLICLYVCINIGLYFLGFWVLLVLLVFSFWLRIRPAPMYREKFGTVLMHTNVFRRHQNWIWHLRCLFSYCFPAISLNRNDLHLSLALVSHLDSTT